jgi:HlyD family secretion protein
VLSSEVARISPGAAVRLSLGPGAAPIEGRVARIEPVAFTKVSALGIEEQRVNVIVDLLPPVPDDQRLGEAFRVDAHIVVSAQDAVLLLPSAALVRDGSRWQVFVLEAGRARARPVRLNDRNADLAWVAEGVRAGETVLLYPGSLVRDGQAVKPR